MDRSMSIIDDKRFMSRFEAGKGPQIEQLISYVTLLGLSGTDLIAVGGKLERDKIRQEKIKNDEIINNFKIEKIGTDINVSYSRRFKVKTINGNYNIEHENWLSACVTNTKTREKRHFSYVERPVTGKGYDWRVKHMILAIVYGDIKLDF